MKISVVVCVYNDEKRITKCLDSIINQTYQDFDILVINDGSTDNTLNVLKRYEKNNENLRIIDKENSGQADCKNIGLKKTNGSFLFFMDSDDYISNDLFEKCVKKQEKYNLDLVLFKFLLKNEISEQTQSINFNFDNRLMTGSEVLKLYFLNSIGPIGRNLLISRDLLIENKIEFPNNRTREDGATIYKILGNSKKSYLIDEELYFYIRHGSSTVSTFNSRNFKDVLTNSSELLYFLEKNSYTKDEVVFNYILNNIFNEYRIISINKKKVSKSYLLEVNNEMNFWINKVSMFDLNKKNKMKVLLFRLKLLDKVYRLKVKNIEG